MLYNMQIDEVSRSLMGFIRKKFTLSFNLDSNSNCV